MVIRFYFEKKKLLHATIAVLVLLVVAAVIQSLLLIGLQEQDVVAFDNGWQSLRDNVFYFKKMTDLGISQGWAEIIFQATTLTLVLPPVIIMLRFVFKSAREEDFDYAAPRLNKAKYIDLQLPYLLNKKTP